MGRLPIDPEDIRRKITSWTKAIVAVHLAGQPCDMDEIHKIAEENHLMVIEDGAHVLDSALYQKLLLFRSHGITRDISLPKKNEGSWYCEQQDIVIQAVKLNL